MIRRIIPRTRNFVIGTIYLASLLVWGLLVTQTVQMAQQGAALPVRATAASIRTQTAAPIATTAAAVLWPTPLRGATPVAGPTSNAADQPPVGHHPKTGRYIAAWMPPSFAEGARASFEANKDILDEISPFWYGTDGTGRLFGTRNDDLVNLAHENNILVIPTVHNIGTSDSIATLLSNPQTRARHIQSIIEEVMARNYDGFDIDYEALAPSMRPAFSAFIKDLAEALHSQGKKLTVAVHAKSSDYGGLGGYQDWKEIGQYVDRLRIMTYDLSWRGSGPGPVSPLYWVQDVAKYAASVVDPGKVEIGVPFYGYSWPPSGNATALRWSDIEALIEQQNPMVNLLQSDTRGRVDESHFTYGGRTIWFSTQNSLDSKLSMIQDMDLAGIVIWQLGYEDPKNWEVIRRRLVEDPFVLQRAINPLLPEH